METKGKVVGVIPNWLNEQDIVTIQVRLELPYTFDNLESLDGLKDKDIKVSLTQWREPRSRSANGYFYVLVGKLADALRVSKPYIHNLMLRKYGQLERIDGRPVWVILPETDEIANKVDEDETKFADRILEGGAWSDHILHRKRLETKTVIENLFTMSKNVQKYIELWK